jgi:hypothetical protein
LGASAQWRLAALLNTFPGALAAGEVRSLWAHGLIGRRLCGCGVLIVDCPVWHYVLKAAPSPRTLSPAELDEYQRKHLRTRDYLAGWPRALLRLKPPIAAQRYATTLSRAYEEIARVSDADVIIDSSKYPLDAYFLASLTSTDLRVVHLVRDPRAVAHSWSRLKQRSASHQTRGDQMRQFSPAASTTIWSVWNGVIETVLRRAVHDRVLTVRYEDLLERPDEVLSAVATFAGLDPSAGPKLHDHEVELGRNHMIAGNPVRFDRGKVALSLDDEWRANMSAGSTALATLPALPWLHRYGYRLWPKHRPPA